MWWCAPAAFEAFAAPAKKKEAAPTIYCTAAGFSARVCTEYVCIGIMIIIFCCLLRSSFRQNSLWSDQPLCYFSQNKKKALFEAARVEEVALIMMALNFVIPCAHTRHTQRETRLNNISTWLNFAAANAGKTFWLDDRSAKKCDRLLADSGRNNFSAKTTVAKNVYVARANARSTRAHAEMLIRQPARPICTAGVPTIVLERPDRD